MKNTNNYRTMDPILSTGILSTDFDEFGLRWPADHLDTVFPKILYWPLHSQSLYVDRIVFELIQKANPEELAILQSNLTGKFDEKSADCINATAVGNLAFIVLYAPDFRLKQSALERIQKICKAQNSDRELTMQHCKNCNGITPQIDNKTTGFTCQSCLSNTPYSFISATTQA